MTGLAIIDQLQRHSQWADEALFQQLSASSYKIDEAWREYAHVLAAEELWLSRIEDRPQRVGIWPTLTSVDTAKLLATVAADYSRLVTSLNDDDIQRAVSYVASDGRPFTNSVRDILIHVAMHGQYHRGKVNLMMRLAGATPAPVDMIAFVRGAPAARHPANDT